MIFALGVREARNTTGSITSFVFHALKLFVIYCNPKNVLSKKNIKYQKHEPQKSKKRFSAFEKM